MNKILIIALFCLLDSGCARTQASAPGAAPVPAEWRIGSETESEPEPSASVVGYTGAGDEDAETEAEVSPTLGETTNALFANEAESLESLPAAEAGKSPWRVSAVLTELSISASGWLGFLVQKGTPSVMTVWRKQNPAAAPARSGIRTVTVEETADEVSLSPEMSRASIERSLEPTIRALVAGGAVHGESNLRKNLIAAAEEFQSVTGSLSAIQPKGQWWISRFRLDLAVDASGNVTPAVVIGSEAKVRFEWHRLQAKTVPTAVVAPRSERASGIGANLVSFAGALADDLSEIADGAKIGAKGFHAYGYRVGLGITAKGTVGVAKTSSTLTGYLYFSRDVTKPVVRPAGVESAPPVLLIGDTDGTRIGKVDRKSFRKGLRKALRIGRFFARRAEKPRGKWRIHELRTGFELSYGGKTGVVTVGGLASTEISFYNLGF